MYTVLNEQNGRQYRTRQDRVIILKITYYSSTKEVLRELGSRIKAERIATQTTQKEMAERTNLSQKTISNLENGKDVSFSTVIEVLRELGRLQSLEVMIPDQGIRPSDIVKYGKQRERVRSRAAKKPESDSGWKWGDEQ